MGFLHAWLVVFLYLTHDSFSCIYNQILIISCIYRKKRKVQKKKKKVSNRPLSRGAPDNKNSNGDTMEMKACDQSKQNVRANMNPAKISYSVGWVEIPKHFILEKKTSFSD